MNTRSLVIVAAVLMVGALLLQGRAADLPAKQVDTGALIVIDSAGKEQKLKSWKFTQGLRHLGWLAPASAKPPEDKEAKEAVAAPRPKTALKPTTGPEALEFREENSTNFVNGIVTLIPLDRLRSLEFNADEETVTAKTGGDKDEALTGSTKFRGINKITLEAEVDKGDLGIAEVKYLGGVARGIKGIRFPAAKSAPAVTGRPASIAIADKGKKTFMPVVDLQVLYRFDDGSEKLSPLLFFKKTLKIDVAKIKKITVSEGENMEVAWQVTLQDGNDESLTLLQTVQLDGKTAELEGLLGKVPAGYKLVPVHTIAEVEFEAAKDKEPAKEKDKEPSKDKDKEPSKDK